MSELEDSFGAAEVAEGAASASGLADSPAEAEGWVAPSQEQWEQATEALAYYEQEQAQALADEREFELYEAQQAFEQGDPEAVERLHALNVAAFEERLAPITAWAEGLQREKAFAEGESKGYELVDAQIERLGADGVTREAVWERANEILAAAQGQAGVLPPSEQAALYGPDAAKLAIEQAADDLAYRSRPYGLGPNAVTNRMFGRDRPSPSAAKPTGLGLGPHPLTSRMAIEQAAEEVSRQSRGPGGGYGNVPGAVERRFFGGERSGQRPGSSAGNVPGAVERKWFP